MLARYRGDLQRADLRADDRAILCARPSSVIRVSIWRSRGEHVGANLPVFRVIGQYHQVGTDSDHCSIRLCLSDIRCREAGLRIEAVHTEVGGVHPKSAIAASATGPTSASDGVRTPPRQVHLWCVASGLRRDRSGRRRRSPSWSPQ